MKETIRTNIIALYSRINEFRTNENYCDVTIKVGEKAFKCHRLILGSASKYFDVMFRGKFKESKSEEIELKEIEATTFEDVIQFIYTGDVVVTKSNLFDLICTSEFYDLPSLKEHCYQFLQEKIEGDILIKNALEVFAFICGTNSGVNKRYFVDSLSMYIRKHLYYFANTPSFLNIQFNELNTILKQKTPSKNENEVMHAIIRWMQQSNHAKDVRGERLNTLFARVKYENISPEFVKFIIEQQCVRKHTASTKDENDKCTEGDDKNDNVLTAESSTDPEVGKMRAAVNSLIPQSLYVYITDVSKKVTNVFTSQKHACGFNWMFLCKANDNSDVMRITSSDNHLYCLNYCKPQASSSSVQTFSVSSSVSLFDKLYLKAPPLVVNQFDMDRKDNWLFMYNKDIFSNIVRSSNDLEFNDEVISRGVYAYNCEIDKWIALPPLLQKLANACMTCNHGSGLLYLIGGRDPTQQQLHGYVQAYDPRCASWMAITPSKDFYENGVCCSSDYYEDSYVSGGLASPKEVEIYNPVAGKWYNNHSVRVVEECYIISHETNEWVFGENVSESSVEVYQEDTERFVWNWSMVSSLSVAVENNRSVDDVSSVSNVLDCVTFKPHGL